MKPLGSADPVVVGPYRLLGVLGDGGMSRVYLGQSATGRRIAVKVVRTYLCEDVDFRARFAREVAAARAVSPLFTAAVVDADTGADPPWLATTYIPGPSLDELVAERGPLPLGALLTLAAGLAEALASIHRSGLAHRDLKPANVIVNDAGPHIIDFGVARAWDSPQASATSMVLGTPSYMPPERMNGEDAGPAGDVFSYGATLVRAATGRSLVDAATVYHQIVQIARGRYDLSAVPKELRPLLVRCLSRQPRDRPTADELVHILVGSGSGPPEPGWYLGSAAPRASDLRALAHAAARVNRRQVLAAGSVLGVGLLGGGIGAVAGLSGAARGRSRRPRPGTVLWQARSGVQPGVRPVVGPEAGRIAVGWGGRIVAVTESGLAAVDQRGRRLWSRTLGAGALDVRAWGDAVLAAGGSRLWLLDPASGRTRFQMDTGATVTGLVLSPPRVFAGLGTATVAYDRGGRELWRVPAGSPLVASGDALVTRTASGSTVEVGLYDADGRAGGQPRWTARYEPAAPDPAPILRPPDGGPPPEDGGPPPQDGGPDGGPPRPPPDRAWRRAEGRLGAAYVVLRDAQDVHVLRRADGGTAWHTRSPRPVAAIELLGDQVVLAADRLTAYAVGSGVPAWASDQRGARVATAPDELVVVSAGTIAGLDPAGRQRWRTELPAPVRYALPDRLTIDGRTAIVTFLPPAGEQPLDADVLAVAVSGQG